MGIPLSVNHGAGGIGSPGRHFAQTNILCPDMINQQPISTNLNDLAFSRYYVQPKLDGIRATWNPESRELLTRNGRAITSVPHIVGALENSNLSSLPLDGEIYSKNIQFNAINGLVRQNNPSEKSGKLAFNIFDITMAPGNFESRLEILKGLKTGEHLKLVSTVKADSQAVANRLYAGFLSSGYEGMVLRQPTGEGIYKIKPSLEIEAQLIGLIQSRVPGETVFEALRLRDDNGVQFTSSLISFEDKLKLQDNPPIGETVTLSFLKYMKSGAPLRPKYKSLRWDL